MSRHSEPRRHPPFATRRYSILVYSGGRGTEVDYFQALKAWLEAAGRLSVSVDVRHKGVAPDQVVQAAIDRRERKPGAYDEVWCVVDVDSFQREGRRIDKAVALAKREDGNLAVSHPCFELWLLLRHADCRSYCADYDDTVGRLRRHVPAYDKADLRFTDFADGVAVAVKRARDLDPSGVDHAQNPSTGVWRLVSTMTEAR